MKKKIASFLLVLIVGVLVFTGCGFQALSGGPKDTDPVSSNGGLVVQKGNFLYFVNGYTAISDLSGEANKFGKVDFSSLYRTELDGDGNLQYDEDGKLIASVLVPKVVGTENCSFYIYGNKIYYASPNSEKGTDGKIDYKLTDFYMSNLDGSNVSRIYKTTVSSTSISFRFYEIDQKVYLAVYDSADLFVIDCSSKDVKKVATGVTGVVLPDEDEQHSFIYYTRSSVDDDNVDNGNILAMASIIDAEEIDVQGKNSTFAVKDFKSNTLIFTKKDKNDKSAYYFKAPVENNKVNLSKQEKISFQAYTNAPLVLNFENGNYRGMVTKNESGYLVYVKYTTALSEDSYEVLNSEIELTPIAIYGDEVYGYNSDNELYSVNYKTKQTKKLSNKDSDTLSFSMANNIDFDGRFVYVYKEYKGDEKSGYYLVRIDTTASDYESKLLGVLQKEHIKTETEEENA